MPRPPVPRGVTWACFVACLLFGGVNSAGLRRPGGERLVEAFPSNLALTLRHFVYVSAHAQALQNTLVYGLGAALLCALFGGGYLPSWCSAGSGPVAVWWILWRSCPPAVPGIFFGIGYASAFNQRWLDWLDRGVLIMISMLFWNIPVGYQAALAGCSRLTSIDEAGYQPGGRGLARLPRYSISYAAQRSPHGIRHRLRACRHHPFGGHLSVHARHHGGNHSRFSSWSTDFNWAGRNTRFTIAVIGHGRRGAGSGGAIQRAAARVSGMFSG